MTMRGKFTAPGTSIHYYVVEFDPTKLSCGRTLKRPGSRQPVWPPSAPQARPLARAAPWPPGWRSTGLAAGMPRACSGALAPAQSPKPPMPPDRWPSRWEDFRGSVLGPTDPKDAPEGALRGIIAKDWEKLGLKAPCNGGDNALQHAHTPASAVPGFGSRASSGRASRLWAARHSQGRGRATGRPATASAARASRLQGHRFHLV